MTYSALLAGARCGANFAAMTLSADWLQGRTAFGGWQAALAMHAMRQVLGNDIPLRSLQINFIAPVPLGEVTATAELLRHGKSAAQLEARILIDGKVAFTAIGIFGMARPSALAKHAEAPPPAAEVDSVSNAPFVDGARPVFTRNFDMRWASGLPPFSGAAHANSQIFVRFCADTIASDAHLVCIADAIPPSAISMLAAPAMISSMNWTLELVNSLHEAERADWLRFDSDVTAAGDGYVWQNTMIWSARGRLIAISRQCVALFG